MVDLPSSQTGQWHCSSDTFYDIFQGLLKRHWSGEITFLRDTVKKTLIIQNGEIVFARSNLIDDRLGEVIFRNGKITIDQLLTSATLVSRQQRFGQVLTASQIFDQKGVWAALQDQIKFILISFFLTDHLVIEWKSTIEWAFPVSFEAHSQEIVCQSYNYGCIFREFQQRLSESADAEFLLTQLAQSKKQSLEGTFLSDMFQLIETKNKMSDFLEGSKLHPLNSVLSLMEMYKKGYCYISPLAMPKDFEQENSYIRICVQGFNEISEKIAEIQSSEFHAQINRELFQMSDVLFQKGHYYLRLSEFGTMTAESYQDMMTIIRHIPSQTPLIIKTISYLANFLLQMAIDRSNADQTQILQNIYRKTIENIQKNHSYFRY